MIHDLSSIPKLKDFQLPGISRDGKEWLTLALDPFHDSTVPIRGYPDRANSQSVVEVYTETLNITAPAGTTGNWTCSIFNAPYMACNSSSLHFDGATRGAGAIPQGTTDDAGGPLTTFSEQNGYTVPYTKGGSFPMSFLNVHKWNADVGVVFPNGNGTYAKPDEVHAMGVAGYNMCRVIGAGFEIVNTTADIYKQGACTVSRMPSHKNSSPANCWMTESGAAKNPFDNTTASTHLHGDTSTVQFHSMYGPPAGLAEANGYGTSKTWNAKDGCYSVISFDMDDSNYKVPSSEGLALISSSQIPSFPNNSSLSSVDSLATVTKAFYDPVASTGAVIGYKPGLHIDVDCDISSVILSGLSKETTFSVTLRYVIEKCPRMGDAGGLDLVRLSSPSASYDRVALDAYRHLVVQMPVGVPSKYNPLGEYWNHIVGLVAKAAPIVSNVAGYLPIPGAAAIAKAAQVVGNAANAAQTASNAVASATRVVNAVKKKKNAKRLKARK